MTSARPYLDEPDRHPCLSALISRADGCVMQAKQPDLVFECRREFDALMESSELAQIVSRSLREHANGDDAHPEWLSKTAEEWVIVDTPHYSLRLSAKKSKPSRLLHSLNFDCIVGNLSGPACRVDVHDFPPGQRVDAFVSGLSAPLREVVSLEPGASMLFRMASDIPGIQIDRPLLLLTLYAKHYAPLIWCFDKETHRSVMAMASHDSPVRRQAGAAMLHQLVVTENLPGETSLQTLTGLVGDEAHFVRWAALQALCAIDLGRARPLLEAAMDDAHPTVAAAARRAVETYLRPADYVEA